MVDLCLITPTIGRPTLQRTLQSAALGANDEWLVIGDGRQEKAGRLVSLMRLSGQFGPTDVQYHQATETKRHGNHQRDTAMAMSDKDYFIFIDDDDIFVPGALTIIRQAIGSSEPCPWFFRMIDPLGQTLWKNQVIDRGNVGGSMLVVPNDPARLGRWSDSNGHDSDFLFIERTLKLWQPTPPKWSSEVIIECKPNE